MSDYIHSNDPRHPDCLPPVAPPDAETLVSPVEVALSERGIPHQRIGANTLLCRGMSVYLWPSREGTYGAAVGYQYAERRYEGQHHKQTSVETLMEHPMLQVQP